MCDMLVSETTSTVKNIVRSHLLWNPSPIGLHIQDRNGTLAKAYAYKEGGDHNFRLSTSGLGTMIRRELQLNFIDLRQRE